MDRVGALLKRPTTWIIALFGLLVVAGVILWGASFLAEKFDPYRFQRQEWEAVARRSQPLVEAIKRYTTDHDIPPPSLTTLVPRYIKQIPSPDAPTGQPYHYYCAPPGKDDKGNSWTLRISAATFGGFDEFLYYPSRNYSQDSTYERIGDWVYYHE